MTTVSTPAVQADRLTVVRDGRTVLDSISLHCQRGEVVGIGGPSGSGKTSLLTALAGLSRPDSGTVRLTGAPTMSLVLQGYGLVPVLTASENVEVVLQAHGRPAAEVASAAKAAMSRMLLDGLGDRLVDRLSGGQQQRVAVARALVMQPDVLLADEPTSELDEANRDHVVGELLAEAERGAVVLIASHDRDVLAACDRVLWLGDGAVS